MKKLQVEETADNNLHIMRGNFNTGKKPGRKLENSLDVLCKLSYME